MTAARRRPPWLVLMDYRMLTASFALLFVAAARHGVGRDFGTSIWSALAAGLIVYPQLLFQLTVCCRDPIAAEMRALVIDSLILGAIVAALGFPLWIGFSAMLGTPTNHAMIKGWCGGGSVPGRIPLRAGNRLAGDAGLHRRHPHLLGRLRRDRLRTQPAIARDPRTVAPPRSRPGGRERCAGGQAQRARPCRNRIRRARPERCRAGAAARHNRSHALTTDSPKEETA